MSLEMRLFDVLRQCVILFLAFGVQRVPPVAENLVLEWKARERERELKIKKVR